MEDFPFRVKYTQEFEKTLHWKAKKGRRGKAIGISRLPECYRIVWEGMHGVKIVHKSNVEKINQS